VQPEIRDLRQNDAAGFAQLLIQLSRETPFTLPSEVENRALASTQPERTRALIEAPGQQVMVATHNAALIGFLAVSQGGFEKNRHACSLMTGVLRDYWRQGVASALLQRALRWVEQRGISRVELTVMESNAPAIGLYQKFGFQREGIKRNALIVDGAPVNEICMARIF
jgi:RimJ/RimL family protein N-acetyltransferase